MILSIHPDTSYLGSPKAKNCTTWHSFLGWLPQDNQLMKLNGTIHVLISLLWFVDASDVEAELDTLFINLKEEKSYFSLLKNWDTPQHPHQFTVIIPLLLDLKRALTRNFVGNVVDMLLTCWQQAQMSKFLKKDTCVIDTNFFLPLSHVSRLVMVTNCEWKLDPHTNIVKNILPYLQADERGD